MLAARPFLIVTALLGASAPAARTITVTPPSGRVITADAGSVIWQASGAETRERSVARLADTVNQGTFPMGRFVFPAGIALDIQSDAGLKACSAYGGTDGGWRATGAVYDQACLIDRDQDGNFDAAIVGLFGKPWPLKASAHYQVERTAEEVSGTTFTTAISYLGAANGDLRLSYREFSNGMARPAFTEDISLPLSKAFPQVVSIKGTRLRIHAISGEGLTYEVLQPAEIPAR